MFITLGIKINAQLWIDDTQRTFRHHFQRTYSLLMSVYKNNLETPLYEREIHFESTEVANFPVLIVIEFSVFSPRPHLLIDWESGFECSQMIWFCLNNSNNKRLLICNCRTVLFYILFIFCFVYYFASLLSSSNLSRLSEIDLLMADSL